MKSPFNGAFSFTIYPKNIMISILNKEALVKEIIFKTSRSSGKGGQNVNKVETKIELFFNVNSSENLNDEQKRLILKKNQNKINSDGELYLTEQSERSQISNKEKAIKKFFRLLELAFKKEKPRKATTPTKSSILKKRKRKEIESEKKKNRKRIFPE